MYRRKTVVLCFHPGGKCAHSGYMETSTVAEVLQQLLHQQHLHVKAAVLQSRFTGGFIGVFQWREHWKHQRIQGLWLQAIEAVRAWDKIYEILYLQLWVGGGKLCTKRKHSHGILDHLLKLMCHFPMSFYLLKLLLFLYLRLTYHAH